MPERIGQSPTLVSQRGTTVAPPDTAMFTQARHLDAMLAEENVEEESGFRTINEPDEDVEDVDHMSD
ncbi:hypothetical protein GQ600_7629 [Phytophthora cactorum]|nr:hypothetical protein GQ600_7629 [Phytophthora cactorum]